MGIWAGASSYQAVRADKDLVVEAWVGERLDTCKHIALATIELPYTEFHHAGHWKLRDQSSLEDLSIDEDAPAVAMAAEPTAMLLFRHYLQGFNNVISIVDDKSAITNQEEVLSAMKRALELCELHVPVLAKHSLSNKRQRQR